MFGCMFILSCSIKSGKINDISNSSLADVFSEGFDLGVAVNRNQMLGIEKPQQQIVSQHFNALTPENDMKWSTLQPSEGSFDFTGADALINYAAENNKKIIGHVLVWHQQVPEWLFVDEQGKQVTREVLLSRMKSHIFEVAGRYKNQIYGWDVVNEALNDDGSLRESKWLEIIGEDFIDYAFLYASQAAPNAKLYYNDYNLFKQEKITGALTIAERLKRKGIRIDGIGAQAHYGLNPPVAELEKTIQRVISQQLDFMITELDITVLKFPEPEKMGADVSLNVEYAEEYNPYAESMSNEALQALAQSYIDLFELFWKYRDHISRVTLWGVSDGDSWRNYWPMQGRVDYPLLFDRAYQAKPFVQDLINIPQSQ